LILQPRINNWRIDNVKLAWLNKGRIDNLQMSAATQ